MESGKVSSAQPAGSAAPRYRGANPRTEGPTKHLGGYDAVDGGCVHGPESAV